MSELQTAVGEKAVLLFRLREGGPASTREIVNMLHEECVGIKAEHEIFNAETRHWFPRYQLAVLVERYIAKLHPKIARLIQEEER